MRIDNANFTNARNASMKRPRYVVEVSFDTANTDVVYLTSGAVSGLSGANVIVGVVSSIAGTTQKLNPSSANATIGSISFSAVDVGLTDLQRTKLNGGLGLRGKRCRFYVGDETLSWSDFVVVQTQIIEAVDYESGEYEFKCTDIQREMRKDLFDVKKVAISATVAAGASTIPVVSTTGFERVQQPASPTGLTDAPGQKVGYLKLPNGCVVRYTGKTASTFTGCVWGRFNTAHLVEDLVKPDGTNADSAPVVEEFVYLEMPAVMLLYAVLTGSLYNDPGESLPAHWHLGIAPAYIRTADFINIGADWWDLSDNDKGVPAVVKGVGKTDGKKFLEENILLMLGAFSPVYANGEIGLRRMTVVHSSGGYVRELNTNNVVSYGALSHDMREVVNEIVIHWNYDWTDKTFVRRSLLVDTDSINKHGRAKPLELKFQSLDGNRHTYDTLKSRFDSIRDRYAGPPLKLDVVLLPSNNDIEVGDVVRVKLENVRDYTGELVDGSLDRNFEVQQVKIDWITGKVGLSLFGSSQPATALPAEESGTILPNGWYTGSGTAINATNFPGKITSSGGITRVTGNITLTGAATLGGAIYHCAESLTIDAGVTVTINNNVQLRVAGFFQCNGTINGAGLGLAGGVASAGEFVSAWNGAAGGLGTTQSQDGIYGYKYYNRSVEQVLTGMNRPNFAAGKMATAAYLSLKVSGSTLVGLPTDIRGTSGPAGGPVKQFQTVDHDDPGTTTYAAGGNGGAGGAGLFVVCRGMAMGAAGVINLSGSDGALGATVNTVGPYDRILAAGAGGGGYCGALYVVLDGPSATPPTFTLANCKLEVGKCPTHASAGDVVILHESVGEPTLARDGKVNSSFRFGMLRQRENTFAVNARVQYLTGNIAANPTLPAYAAKPAAVVLTEATNTPPTPAANLSSIEVAVTPPSDTNYSYSRIYYRVLGQAGWTYRGPASPETAITVASDGSTYEVLARSVSKSGRESADGVTNTITVALVQGATNGTLDTIAPLAAVTGLALKDYAGTVFGGRDAKFKWDAVNATLDYFWHYRVEILNGSAVVIRTETTVDPFFVYTYEKNAEDYKNSMATDGANRSFSIRVTPVSRLTNNLGQKHTGPAVTLAVSNTSPGLPSGLGVVGGYTNLNVVGTLPTDLDFVKLRVHISTTSGFTAGAGNLVAESVTLPVVLTQLPNGDPLERGTTYYLRIIPFDTFGAGSTSVELFSQTLGVPASDEIPVGEVMTVNGRVIVDPVADPYSVTLGPHSLSSRVALFSFQNSGSPVVAMYEGGAFEVTGSGGHSMKWNGTALEVQGDIKTATTGKRIEINKTNNEFFVVGETRTALEYGSNITECVNIGPGVVNSWDPYIFIGDIATYGTSGDPAPSSDFQRWGLLINNYGLGASIRSKNSNALLLTNGSNDATLNVQAAWKQDSTWSGHLKGINVSVPHRGTAGIGIAYGVDVSCTTASAGVTAYGTRSAGADYDFYANGAGTNYGPFTGAHDALIPKATTGIEPGDIVRATGIAARNGVSNVIAAIGAQSNDEARDSFGVFVWRKSLAQDTEQDGQTNRPNSLSTISAVDYATLCTTHDRASVNGVGEGQINVCAAGGDIAIGDFITSSTVPGKGKRYDGSDMRVVVARALEAVDWSEEPGTTKQIGCIYLCG